jgi:hypothetical protein
VKFLYASALSVERSEAQNQEILEGISDFVLEMHAVEGQTRYIWLVDVITGYSLRAAKLTYGVSEPVVKDDASDNFVSHKQLGKTFALSTASLRASL